MTPIRVLKNEGQYKQYLMRIDEIFDAKPGSDEGVELELLLVLIKLYEDEHYPIPYPDPIMAIKTRMEDLGWKNKDLEVYIGDKGNVSKILSGKRRLTVDMIRKLSRALDLPIEVLVGESDLQTA